MGIVMIIYGALMLLAGIVGYRRKKSGASLVVGGFSGFLLLHCGGLNMLGMSIPVYIGFAWTVLLCLLFGRRWRTTKEMRPAGAMFILSTIFAVIMLAFFFV